MSVVFFLELKGWVFEFINLLQFEILDPNPHL